MVRWGCYFDNVRIHSWDKSDLEEKINIIYHFPRNRTWTFMKAVIAHTRNLSKIQHVELIDAKHFK